MFCYRRNEAVLRFSYVSESLTFAEDGTLKKESTDTKRFTYLLGEGHRSRTAIEQFEKLRDSELSLKDITKAFSIEALGDLFFKEYKKQYEGIIEYITGKRMVKVANKWEEQTTGQPCQEIMQEFAKFDDQETYGTSRLYSVPSEERLDGMSCRRFLGRWRQRIFAESFCKLKV